MTEDTGASILTDYLLEQIPFFFLRYGDGALECINKVGGKLTCDGELYSEVLGKALLDSWNYIIDKENVFIGDWRTTIFNAHDKQYFEEYAALLKNYSPKLIHFHSLLLRNSNALLNFYQAIKNDNRKKLYVGPEQHSGIDILLHVRHLAIPIIPNLYTKITELTECLEKSKCDVILYAAGMAGAVAAIRCHEKYPKRTYIHLGSALDPLFRGRTRSHQLPIKEAKALFAKLI